MVIIINVQILVMIVYYLKKSNPNYINPIYVKGLLDNPMENNNYFEIQHIFSKVIEDINQIYHKEIRTLESIMEKMPLKDSIKSDYIKPAGIFRVSKITTNPNTGQQWEEIEANNGDYGVSKGNKGEVKKITFEDILKHYPEAEIWYLKDKFRSNLHLMIILPIICLILVLGNI